MSLTIQHCLAIAASFIAIMAACATLITSANNKADSLANRIRGAAKEHRECKDETRRKRLQRQVEIFEERFCTIQHAQRLLLRTVGMFILSLAIFIPTGLYLLAGGAANPLFLYALIGVFVTVGSLCMLRAIYLQHSELGRTSETLQIEIADCKSDTDKEDNLKDVA